VEAESTRGVLARRIDKYTNPGLTAVCSFVFFLIVPMMPGSPILPLIAAAGLGFYSVRDSRRAAQAFYLLVFAAIVWQLYGFGLQSLVAKPFGALAAFLLLVPLLVNAMNPRMSPSSLALTFLAVGLMLTPEYFLAVPLIAAAVALDGLGSVAATVITFVLTFTPFLLIENAIYFGALAPGAAAPPPIVFAQLTHLDANLRPALPGLNVFLTGLPNGFVSPQSAQVATFLISKSYLMLVPITVFILIFAASASIAGFLTKSKERLTVFPRVSKVLKAVWPIVVTTVTTSIFAVLLALLSSASVGGYQAQLGQASSYFTVGWMVGTAGIMGFALSVRAYLDEGLMAITKAEERLAAALAESKELLESLLTLCEKVNALAPSVGLRVEEGVLDQYSSYVLDVARQKASAGPDAMNTWEGEIRVRIIPTLKVLPEQIRIKVINEVTSVSSLAESLNSTLEHLGVGTRFPAIREGTSSMDTEEALEAYGKFASDLKARVMELYAFYLEAAKALDKLLDRTVSEPPVSPDVLLSTSDFVTAMRLLGEEYSMNLHTQYLEELKAKVSDLSAKLRRLGATLGEEGKELLRLSDMGDPRPLESTKLLKKVEGVVAYLRAEAERMVADSTRLADMVGTLMPAATNVLKFATLAELGTLKELRREAKALGPGLEKVGKFIDRAGIVFAAHLESGRKDEENLIVIAQYPLAWKVIHELAAAKPVISLAELPFQPDAAHLYARIYAANEPSSRYDEQGEALLIAHA
jgi:hypothetical protein